MEPMANGVTLGPISGFGSVIVNGQRFDTSAAVFRVNGEAATQGDLRVGMIIRADVDFDTLTAARVDFESSLIGSVESVDVLNGALTVLRQNISLSPNTLLDNVTLAEVSPGDFLEISGIRDATGTLIASHVRRAGQAGRLQISGDITSLQTAASTFVIGGLLIDYSEADLSGLTEGLVNGLSIVASGATDALDAGSGRLAVTSLRSGLLADIETGSEFELEGIVTDVESTTRFSVNGQQVAASPATVVAFDNGAAASTASIALNSRLEVEGILSSSGTLVATRIIVIPVDNSELTGRIENLEPSSESLTVLGVTITSTARTRYEGDNDLTSRGGYDTLRIGDYVEIKASYIGSTLTASRIDVKDFDEEAKLRGPVTAIDVPALRIEILGVAITLDNNTDVELDGSESPDIIPFLNALQTGDLVEVQWDNFLSTDLPPDSVESE